MTTQPTFTTALQHHRAGRLKEAEALYQQILIKNPFHAPALELLGVIAFQKGQFDDAVKLIRNSISIAPDVSEAHYNLANALVSLDRVDEAIAAFRRSISLQPDLVDAHVNLGNTLNQSGQTDEAIAAYQQALLLRPNFPEAVNNLGNALTNSGEIDAAITQYRRACSLRPHYAEAHANLLFCLNYHPGYHAARIAEEHRLWNRLYAEPLRQSTIPAQPDRQPVRRLRIGYVSPDLRAHPVGRFLLPLLANHDRKAFEIFAYPLMAKTDAMTDALRAHADHWRSLVGLSDDQAADLIRADHIDILVDLAGHTGFNRLPIFARKPAPVQVSFLGYPNTTGLTAMDYRLTDDYADPPGQTEQHHSEKLIRLSPCAWCFQPADSPPITARDNQPIVFGCFNAFPKITQPMLEIWSRILLAVPQSRLLLKSAAISSAGNRRRLLHRLSALKIDPNRVELRGQEPNYSRHLARYGNMDIALDTFPYHGTTTTCEALWMGVPVITLAGNEHRSRVGVSLLNNAGLPELVAATPEQYIRIAIDLAANPTRRKTLRSTLREQLQASPLMNAPAYARGVESAYKKIIDN